MTALQNTYVFKTDNHKTITVHGEDLDAAREIARGFLKMLSWENTQIKCVRIVRTIPK